MPSAGPIAAERHEVLMPTTSAALADLAKEYDKSQGEGAFMNLIILLFAFLIAMTGIVLMVRPPVVMDFLESNSDKTWIYASAILVRALLGWIMIQQSIHSKFPLTIEILGWLMLFAALFLLLLGRSRFTRLIRWLMTKLRQLSRLAGLFALVFGAFLVYAFF